MQDDGTAAPAAKTQWRAIPADPLLTIEQVAEQLQVSGRSVLRLVAASELRAIRIGRLWRVRSRDLEEYLRLRTSR